MIYYMGTNEMDQMYSAGIDYTDEPNPNTQKYLIKLRRASKELCKEDQLLYSWLIKKGAIQEVVGKVLGIDRSNVSLQKDRLIEKLKYFTLLPYVDWQIVDEKIADISVQKWEIATTYRLTKNYRQTAKHTKIPETTVRRRLQEMPDLLIGLEEFEASTYYSMLFSNSRMIYKRTK